MYCGFIYEWTNKLNGKKYIGSHIGNVDDGYIGSGKVFKQAIKKYGIENFTRNILEYIDINDQKYLLEREKYHLDKVNAYYSKNYYNVAKDVIGGDTKAGWSEERRKKFKQRIKNIWANRSEEEKDKIRNKAQVNRKKWLESNEGKIYVKEQRERFYKHKEKIIEAIKNIPFEVKSRSMQLAKERMGVERRKEAAHKGVKNRNPKTETLARQKSKETRANWSEEKRKEVFKNSSRGRKGKCAGSQNGRARKIFAEGKTFDTLKMAMVELNISEFKLNCRLKDPNNKEYYYL